MDPLYLFKAAFLSSYMAYVPVPLKYLRDNDRSQRHGSPPRPAMAERKTHCQCALNGAH